MAADNPNTVAELDHMLLEFLHQHTAGAASQRDPFQEQLRAGIDPDLYCTRSSIEQRLIQLQRDDQLADLSARHNQRSPNS